MAVTFLFWNLNRKPIQSLVANLVRRHEVDVLMLAECSISPGVLLTSLNKLGNRILYQYVPNLNSDKIKIFTKFAKGFIPFKFESARLTISHLKLPRLTDILLSVTHFPSKTHWSESSLAAECVELSHSIREIEKEIGHSRTVLVGDMNMNPFEKGMVNANGLNSVMAREIAQRKTRTVLERHYPFFYNPMWSLLGDASPGPPGTYYYSSSEHTAFFWHMFDQVLIRPDLFENFSNNDLKILSSDGEISFLSPNGFPNKKIASDHLPIVFKLRLYTFLRFLYNILIYKNKIIFSFRPFF